MRSKSFYSFSVLLVVVLVSATTTLGRGIEAASRKGDLDRKKRLMSWNDFQVDEHQRQRLISKHRNLNNNDGIRVIVVNKEGTGDSRTVQGAVNMVPNHNNQRVKIFILPGIYREKVFIPSTKPYISFIGDEGRVSDTVITWHNKASDKDSNGNELGTYRTASVSVESDYFAASEITFENSANPKPKDSGRQAVALRIAGDKAIFYKSRFIGKQDTLLDEQGIHYFYQCHIQGTVDFIFGQARSLYEQCVITSTAKSYGAIAAHHRASSDENTGFSFVRCIINGSGKIFLGRAWGRYSRTIYAHSHIEDVITPEGWSDWNDRSRQRTAVFGQYNCTGHGANTKGRVKWAKTFNYEKVKPFLDMKFIDGHEWLNL